MIESDITYHGPVVAFDLDDTLYEEADYVLSGISAVASEIDRRKIACKTKAEHVMRKAFEDKRNFFDILEESFPESGLDLARDIVWILDVYRTHRPELKLSDNIINLLENIRKRGWVTCIVTDGRSITQRNKILSLGLNEFFSPGNVFISEETGSEKTEGKSFEAIVRHYPEASGFWYVGDNPLKDFYAANLLGWHTVCLLDQGRNIHTQHFDNSFSDARYHISQLEDLEKIILEST